MSKITVWAPISVGELLDKISILQLKMQHASEHQRANCEQELCMLTKLMPQIIPQVSDLQHALFQVNEKIWHLEDAIRHKEHSQVFDDQFVHMARQIYTQNDLRAQIKKQINLLTDSQIQEEKVY